MFQYRPLNAGADGLFGALIEQIVGERCAGGVGEPVISDADDAGKNRSAAMLEKNHTLRFRIVLVQRFAQGRAQWFIRNNLCEARPKRRPILG